MLQTVTLPSNGTAVIDEPGCHCDGTGWIVVPGRGAHECHCRIQARLARKLAVIPTEFESLRLHSSVPDVRRHSQQALVWRAVQAHPEQSYLLCGDVGAGKSAVLWALYAYAVEQQRPAIALSLAALLEDYKRAELKRSEEEEFVPLLPFASLQTKAARWFIGIDDFHLSRPTRFAAEMLYRLLDAACTYRHQVVITSQLDRHKLAQHWAQAGDAYGAVIMRRVLESEGARYLTMFAHGRNYFRSGNAPGNASLLTSGVAVDNTGKARTTGVRNSCGVDPAGVGTSAN